MASKKQDYGNESISALKGADRVRKRPGVIFGSDGLEGCEHAVFEILSNSIDEAREGHGSVITVTRFAGPLHRGGGRGPGLPGGLEREGAAVQLGAGVLRAVRRRQVRQQRRGQLRVLPGPQRPGLLRHPVRLASIWTSTVWRDGFEYTLHFEQGENVGGAGQGRPAQDQAKKTGTRIRWLPDLDVFTDIDIPAEYFTGRA